MLPPGDQGLNLVDGRFRSVPVGFGRFSAGFGRFRSFPAVSDDKKTAGKKRPQNHPGTPPERQTVTQKPPQKVPSRSQKLFQKSRF